MNEYQIQDILSISNMETTLLVLEERKVLRCHSMLSHPSFTPSPLLSPIVQLKQAWSQLKRAAVDTFGCDGAWYGRDTRKRAMIIKQHQAYYATDWCLRNQDHPWPSLWGQCWWVQHNNSHSSPGTKVNRARWHRWQKRKSLQAWRSIQMRLSYHLILGMLISLNTKVQTVQPKGFNFQAFFKRRTTGL